MRFPSLAVPVLAGLAACAAGRGAGATRSHAAPAALLYRDHPLAGRALDVRAGELVPLDALPARLAAADHVLLGETHDNPEHHRVEALLLRGLVAAGRRPAVAFEMLDVPQQAAVDAAVARSPRDPDALAEAVGWDRSGWPAFALYRPVFAAALDAGLPIVAANLGRAEARRLARQGTAVLRPDARALLERAGPLSEASARALRAEMAASHCGELPEAMLDPMVQGQRGRDATLAARVLAAAEGRGAVLVAGAGHVRADHGVPSYLPWAGGAPRVATVGMLEVAPDAEAPGDYADAFGGALPFDYVVFTPAADRHDPCEELRRAHPKPPEGTPL